MHKIQRLETVDLSSFNTSQVEDMRYMFSGAASLESLDLCHFDTSQLEEVDSIFRNTASLMSLNLRGWDISSVTSSSLSFDSTNVGLSVLCNDQDNTPDGTGVAGTGQIFGEDCN